MKFVNTLRRSGLTELATTLANDEHYNGKRPFSLNHFCFDQRPFPTHFLALAKTCHDQRPFPTNPSPSAKTSTYQPPLNFQRLGRSQFVGQRLALAGSGVRRAEFAGHANASNGNLGAISDRRPRSLPDFTRQARLLPVVSSLLAQRRQRPRLAWPLPRALADELSCFSGALAVTSLVFNVQSTAFKTGKPTPTKLFAS